MISVSVIGFFNTLTSTQPYAYISGLVDNIYVSDEGWYDDVVGTNRVPSWLGIAAEFTEDFDADPSSNWIEEHGVDSNSTFTWVDLTGEYQAGGYIDAQVWRSADPDGTLYPGWTYPTYVAPATEARYYCVLPSFYQVLCDSAANINSGIGWYCQFDIYAKDIENYSTSILGTAAGFGAEPWHDNTICGIEAYGATGVYDGIRIRTSGWDDGSNEALVPTGNPTGEVDANSVDTVIGGLLPNKSYRLKFYLGARNNLAPR